MTTAGMIARRDRAQPGGLASRVKRGMRHVVPLGVRKQIAVWLGRQRWLSQRHWWSAELVRDLAERNIAEYHRFLWTNHLAYAQTYEVEQKFGAARVHPSRVMLFEDLCQLLEERGTRPQHVNSVLEVGCSMGYLLHHLEQHVFTGAHILDGVDVDGYAITQGAGYLRNAGSRVRLRQADMKELGAVVDGSYDVVICAGVLMYVPQTEALDVVRTMLARCTGLLVLAGLAHPEQDNATLESSEPRLTDRSFIHNLDVLVERAGGRVVRRRWEGARSIDGNTIYFVYAEPGHGPAIPTLEIG